MKKSFGWAAFILGTERHEARRIDNQLRGRAGRQGDPGASRFYISLEDDLMRILGADRIKGMLVRAGMSDGVPIEYKMVSRAIENAQKQIESQNFSMRKHLLEYDDVMNKQRQFIYAQRRDILMGKDFKAQVFQMTEEIFEEIFNYHIDEKEEAENWGIESFQKEILAQFGLDIYELLNEKPQSMPRQELKDKLLFQIKDAYKAKENLMGSEQLREMERIIMLQIIDSQWKDHLLNIDHLKEGIGLRGYAQKDPLIEYKKESYDLFQSLQQRMDEEVTKILFLFRPVEEEEIDNWREKEGQNVQALRQTAWKTKRQEKKR